MRDLKFRGWDIENKKMYYGVMVGDVIPKDHTRKPTIHLPDECGRYMVGFVDADDFELMQYTGLKDKNGKEIYEGDIVRCLGVSGIKEIAWGGHWEYAGFGLSGKREGREDWETEDTWDALNPQYTHHLEVIGNIHSNKELLDN